MADTIPLTQFAPDAERIIFDVGYDRPSYLSINANNELIIASNAATETTPVYVALKAINRIDATETGTFGFYLIIEQDAAPVWRSVNSLTMPANSTYDLYQIVEGADSVAFKTGTTQPTDSTLEDGIFTIATTGGTAEFTATKGSLTSNIAINIDVVQAHDPENFSDVFRHKVEIAGIDVTDDVRTFPEVSKSLDAVLLNRYVVDEVTLNLIDAGGKYHPDIADNFWTANGLQSAGYNEPVKVYLESLVNSAWVETLIFSGLITEQVSAISDIETELLVVDVAAFLQNEPVRNFGDLVKWDGLRPQSDEAGYEAVYVPEPPLLGIQAGSGKAWESDTPLTIRELALPSEGPSLPNTGYLTDKDFRTSGGFLDTRPILRFKTQARSEDIRSLFQQLARVSDVYNTEIALPEVTAEMPFILNRGSVPLSVEQTRITRLPVDWVYDSTKDRILMLLSNPEGHISDWLVALDRARNSYRVLHKFDKDVKVHRIAQRNPTEYYILTSGAISQDRSAPTLPRAMDATGYAYDSVGEGSTIRIYRYDSGTDTLTLHVAESNNLPPQLGVHYYVVFENDLYIDEFEGIVPYYRGPFKWNGSHLYYRYAKDGEFGAARVDASGSTARLIHETDLGNHNHLNFGFDVTSGGEVYFVYVTGDTETSTLIIKRRTSGGTESTILSETRGIGDFNDIGLDFGAFLGCYEALFYNNNLYILCPIQKADLGDDNQSIINPDVNIERRSREKSGERNVTRSTNLNPSNLTLTPGDDIPLRIDFDGTVSGATRDDLTVYGGTIQAFSISSDMIDVTIRPDSKARHKNIIIDVAEDAVGQTNEAWRITIDFETTRSRTKSVGMALYRCNVTVTNPTLTFIEKYDFVSRGACNLHVHDGSAHFMEHSPALEHFRPINPDLDGYWTDAEETKTMGYNLLPETLGALKKINADATVEALGNFWYEDRPLNIAATRPLSINGSLHVMMGYGNIAELLRFNSLPSQVDNVQHLIYGNTLQYIVPEFSPSVNIYQALQNLAETVGATLSFDGNLITVQDRHAYRAETDDATGTGSTLAFENANKTFPDSGYLRIGDELMQYTGISGGNTFTGLTRGVLGTTVADHTDGSVIVYCDAVLESEDIQAFTPRTDTTNLYNVIRDNAQQFEVEDDDSPFPRRAYTLDLGLTQHEGVWTESVFDAYLTELEAIQYLLTIEARAGKRTNALRIGSVVAMHYAGLVYTARIVSFTYGRNRVRIRGRTV